MKTLFILVILMFYLFAIHSYNLSCGGRSGYLKITINNNATYIPQFWITFGIRL